MLPQDRPDRKIDLSCTFCGPGTWAVWEVIAEDGVFFVCDRHHVEMSEAKMIKLERRMGDKTWKQIRDYDEFSDINDYEQGR